MKKICCLIVVVSLLSGCASIVSKSEWPIKIGSTPDQANVVVTDSKSGEEIFKGTTPTIVTLSSRGGYFKGKAYTVNISKDGYAPQTTEIISNMNGWFWGNILFGGLIGILIVDPLTGAMWTLDPSDINLVLEQNKISKLPNDQKSLTVVSLDNVPDHLRNKLVKIK